MSIDTASESVNIESKPALYAKTRYANLAKSTKTGVYFIRAKVGGKLIRDSLKTNDERVALSRLAARLEKERCVVKVERESRAGRMLFLDCIADFLKASSGNQSIKPLTKKYHREVVRIVKSTWPDAVKSDISKITEDDCRKWAKEVRAKYSPSRYNGCLQAVQEMFRIAIKAGARLDNPAAEVERLGQRVKASRIPSAQEFGRLIEYLDSSVERQKSEGGKVSMANHVVRVLAFSGMRINEARNLLWSDVDFEKKEIQVRIAKKRATDTSPPRRVPMNSSLEASLRLLRELTGDKPKVLPISDVKSTLKRVLIKLNIPHFTHHDLRHLFATKCIESGVDIPTVSRWLGHKDGGALAMKVYGHLRDDHSKAMAAKVKF